MLSSLGKFGPKSTTICFTFGCGLLPLISKKICTDLPHQPAHSTRAHRSSALRPGDALAVQGRMAVDEADQDKGIKIKDHFFLVPNRHERGPNNGAQTMKWITREDGVGEASKIKGNFLSESVIFY